MPSDLNTFFYPKSVAVIGASRNPEKLGSIILKNIVESGFSGDVYPVNPKAEQIQGLSCYSSVSELPGAPELAIVSVPAALVIEVTTALGELGVANVVVLTAGFKEIGSEGQKLEQDLVTLADKYKMNLLGPNCLGFMNNLAPINATFAAKAEETGNLRFVTQSGAIAASLFDYCNTVGLGISEFITLGNKAGLTENDILYYFHTQNQNTLVNHAPEGLSELNPIGLYLESIANGPEFLRLVEEITKKDPVLILKPGKTKAAADAMQSHTGSIAGEDAVLDEVLKQAGATRCYTLEEFFDFSRAFAWEDVPAGPKVAVISNAGGPAVISADAVVEAGLEFAQLDEETKKKLSEALPRSASIVNPVDVLGDALADRFTESIDIVLGNKEVDSLIVLLTPQLMTEPEKTAETIGELSKKHKKPIFCSFIGGHSIEKGKSILDSHKIPSFAFPERAISAVASMWRFKEKQGTHEVISTEEFKLSADTTTIKGLVEKAVKDKNKTMDNIHVDEILRSIDVNTPETARVSTFEEALEFSRKVNWPVVLKMSSPGLLHKDEVGGVHVDIMNEKDLDYAWHSLERKMEQLEAPIKENVSFQIQKEVMGGVEVIVGVKSDPTFGPLLLFGAGGKYAELAQDRNIHLLPMDLASVKRLVEQSKIYPLLKGKTGDLPPALDKLYDLILKISRLSTIIPEATDIEINPVIVTLNDVWAVDGKVVLKIPEVKKPTAPVMKEATCISTKRVGEHYYESVYELSEDFAFKAGQYVSVKVAPDAIRAYSIATHDGPRKFTLLVDIRPGGPGSKFFESIKVGDKMPFLGPFGNFVLNNEDGAEHMMFLGTGSGISALRCMIDAALLDQGSDIPITLYLGLMHDEEIFWKDHMEELVKKYPHFEYEFVIFEPSDEWKGPTGYNTELVKENFKDASKCAVYLCGHPAMISSATDLVRSLGCPEERIYSERFA